MKRGLHRLAGRGTGGLLAAALAVAGLLPLAVGGCGEKIAIPEATSIWANLAYSVDDSFEVAGVRDLITSWGNVFVLTADGISKRNRAFEVDTTVTLTGDPTALCADETGQLVLVWEQTTQTVQFFDSTELEPLGSATLPEVQSCSSMVTASAGVDSLFAGGRTFLYLTDPDAGLVHRYAVMGADDESFFCSECLLPAGILAWPTGAGARSVHQPGGLALDSEGRVLVCETDPGRNWVLRFDSTPDETDTTPIDPEAEEPIDSWAGTAVIFDSPTCAPEPAAADYVLGDAAACNESDWVGGASDAEGEFDRPTALAIDGEGKIYVADYGNDRVQIFGPRGVYQAQFRVRGAAMHPTGIGVIDVRGKDGTLHYAAFAFVLTESSDRVLKLISSEHYLDENGELPYEE